MSKYRSHWIAGVTTAALMVTVVACGGPDPSTPAAVNSVGTPPEVIVNENLTWGDDHAHLVVVTVNGTDAVAADTAPTDVPAPVADASSDDGDGTIVTRADGTVETVIIQRESLTFVAGATGVGAAGLTGVEAAALAAGGPGAFIVVDTNGVAGLAGVRYVLGGDMLTEIAPGGTTTIEAPAGETPDAETAAGEANLPATGAASSDVAIAAEIADIAGVLSVRPVGPGLIEVTGDATDPDLADRIGAVGGVVSVADDVLLGYTGDPRQGEQWAIANTGSPSQADNWPGVVGADIAAPAAWTVANGAGVTVAVIDSGVELAHPDLATRMWTNTAETSCTNGVDDDANGFVDDCNGWDFGNSDKNPNPDVGSPSAEHGTHVAGIIAAGANNVGIVGVAPGAKIMALKVGNSSGGISGTAVAAAINYARANGAKVINISLGTEPGSAPRSAIWSIENAINAATAAGVVVVVAAGNDSEDITNNTVWPAGLSVFNSGVITVGASTNSDTLANFSNTGAPISLVAPGWFIMSSVLNSSWGFMSGTSMAAPYVAGSAAVVVSSGQVTTPAALRTRLVSTADTTTAGKRLNVAAAVGVTRGAGVAPVLAVTYTGAGALVPDTSGTLGMRVSAGPSSGVTQVRLSIATREGGAVAAVEGVTASFSDSSGVLASTATSALGAFPAVALRDTSGLNNAGATVNTNLNLPAGDYAFVTELLTAGGVTVGGAQVAYLTVSDSPAVATTVPASTVAANPLVTTTTPANGGSPVTNPPAPGGTGTTVPPVTAPGGGGGGGGGTPPTTSPPAPVPTTPGTGNPATTAPSTPTAPAVTAPITTNPGAPVTTAPAGGSGGTVPAVTSPPATTPATSAPATTAPPVTAPPVTAPPATTPPPPAAVDGIYSAVSMNPRSSSMCGGTSLTITGQFPTTVPVYVWFGTQGPVSAATVTESQLTVQAPAVLNARIVDVSVRFTLARPYALTLTSALTYTTATCSSGSGATTTTVAAGGGGTPATTTPPTTPGTTSPATPGTTSPATPGTTAPPVTSPVTTPGVQGGAVVGTRKGLTLRTPAAGGVLASLTVSAWPTAGCRQSTCAAAGL